MGLTGKNLFCIGVLAIYQIMMLCFVQDIYSGNTQNETKLVIAVKGIKSAVDAYRIKFELSKLRGVKKVKFIVESDRFRGCCTVSEEYNLYLRSLSSLPMEVYVKDISVNELLEFLNKTFKEFSFENVK